MTAATLSPLRIDRVTASRLPALLDISPYSTPQRLMREMVREHFGDEKEFAGNIATEWGHDHEATIMAEYELTRGVILQYTGPNQQTVVHPRLDFLAATPDGLTKDLVVEGKAPFKSRYTSIAERPDYEAQARLLMECTGRRRCDLAIWRKGQPLTVDTVVHDRDWLPGVLPKVQAFLAEFRETVADPSLAAPHREPLKDVRTDDAFLAAEADWLNLDFLIRQLERGRTDAAAVMARLSPDKPARGAAVDLLRYERRGQVQYRKVVEDNHVVFDPEAYRGKSAQVVTVRRIGGRKEQ